MSREDKGAWNLQLSALFLSHGLKVVSRAIFETSTRRRDAVLAVGRLAADAAFLADEAVATAREGAIGQADKIGAKVTLKLREAGTVGAIVAATLDVPFARDGDTGNGTVVVAAAVVTAAGVGLEVGAVDVVAIAGTLSDIAADVDGGNAASDKARQEDVREVHIGGLGEFEYIEGG